MAARVPPHDLDSEEALLGAIMLSRDAMKRARDELGIEDWYKPAHRTIYAATLSLSRREAACDPVTLAAELARIGKLDTIGGRRELLRLQASCPASMNAEHYVFEIAELAACRRAIDGAQNVIDRGYERDLDGAMYEWRRGFDPPLEAVEDPKRLGDLMASTDPPYNYCIEGLLEYGERVAFTGVEGGGKSTLSRQIACCAAAGWHPFAAYPTAKRRTLMVDLQNTEAQNRREYRRLYDYFVVRGLWDDALFGLICNPAGIDLTREADARWLRSACERHQTELLCIGPLYNAFHGSAHRSKDSEETAEIVLHVLNEIRVAYGTAIVLEAHSPWGDRGDRAGFRIRGSSAWQGDIEYIFGLRRMPVTKGERPYCEVERARGERDRSRRWPKRLYEGDAQYELPWVAEAD